MTVVPFYAIIYVDILWSGVINLFTTLLILAVLIVPVISILIGIKQSGTSPYRAVLNSILATMTVALVIVVAASISGHGLFDTYHNYAVEASKIIIGDGNLSQMVGVSDMTNAKATKAIIALYDQIFSGTPGYLLLITTLISYFDYCILSRIFGGNRVTAMPKFREFTFPQGIVMAMVIMYFVAFFLSKSGMTGGETIYQNVNYLFDLVFIIQGASCIFMICHTKRWPKVLAVILIIICWNIYILREAIVLVGMFDLIFNFKGIIILRQQLKDRNNDNKGRKL